MLDEGEPLGQIGPMICDGEGIRFVARQHGRASTLIASAVVGLLGCGPSSATPARAPSAERNCASASALAVIDLPTWSAPPISTEPILRIDIDAQARVSIEGKAVADPTELLDGVRKVADARTKQRPVIFADKRVAFQAVVNVMEALGRAGYPHIAFGVTPIGERASSPSPWDEKDCPFPAEADQAKIDSAFVVLRVVVSDTGKPESVEILSDPGHGFAESARACAMKQTFEPGTNSKGIPVRSTTPPIRLRFER